MSLRFPFLLLLYSCPATLAASLRQHQFFLEREDFYADPPSETSDTTTRTVQHTLGCYKGLTSLLGSPHTSGTRERCGSFCAANAARNATSGFAETGDAFVIIDLPKTRSTPHAEGRCWCVSANSFTTTGDGTMDHELAPCSPSTSAEVLMLKVCSV